MKNIFARKNNLMLSLILYILFSISLISCHSQVASDNSNLRKSKNNLSDASKVVGEFMKLVESGKISEARKLTGNEKPVIKEKNVAVADPFDADWAEHVRSQGFVLKEISNEKIEGDKTVIETKLQLKHSPDIIVGGEFSLKKINQEWKIVSFEINKKKN